MKDDLPKGRVGRGARSAKLIAGTAVAHAATAARTIGTSAERREAARLALHEREAKRYVDALGNMKGALMKFGQALALVEGDVVPAPFRAQFASLLSGAHR